jgi:hypothetical protein
MFLSFFQSKASKQNIEITNFVKVAKTSLTNCTQQTTESMLETKKQKTKSSFFLIIIIIISQIKSISFKKGFS